MKLIALEFHLDGNTVVAMNNFDGSHEKRQKIFMGNLSYSF